jgi:hypothetical protein
LNEVSHEDADDISVINDDSDDDSDINDDDDDDNDNNDNDDDDDNDNNDNDNDNDNDDTDENKKKRMLGIIKDILEYNVDFDYPDILQGAPPTWITIPIPTAIQTLVDGYRSKQSVAYLKTLQKGRTDNPPPNHVDFRDKWGKTALHRAVENAQLEAVKLLLFDKNAREDITDYWGNTAYEALKRRYNAEVYNRDKRDYYDDDSDIVGILNNKYRYEEGDRIAIDKLSTFRAIGQYFHDYRLFRDRLSLRMRRPIENADDAPANDAPVYPLGVLRQISEFLYVQSDERTQLLDHIKNMCTNYNIGDTTRWSNMTIDQLRSIAILLNDDMVLLLNVQHVRDLNRGLNLNNVRPEDDLNDPENIEFDVDNGVDVGSPETKGECHLLHDLYKYITNPNATNPLTDKVISDYQRQLIIEAYEQHN